MVDMNPYSLMAEAHRLRYEAMAWCHGGELDESGAQWLMTEAAWDFFREEVARQGSYVEHRDTQMRRLYGIPVRLTCNDDPNTPMLQLVMEPKMAPRLVRR